MGDSDTNAITPIQTIDGNVTLTEVTCVCGDTNGDEVVNYLDITGIMRIVAGIDSIPAAPKNGDANCDGNTNYLDITGVMRIVAGIDNTGDGCTC